MTSPVPSGVAGVRARIEAAVAQVAHIGNQDDFADATWDLFDQLAAFALAVIDLADDAETVPWPMDYALVSVDELRAAVVAAFQPNEENR